MSAPKVDLRRCLTIKQPWAWLIIRPDLPEGSPEREAWLRSRHRKNIENRGWSTSYRGRLWIHAGLGWDQPGYEAVKEYWPIVDMPPKADFQHGGLIGFATLTTVVDYHESPWFSGPKGWVLDAPTAAPFEPMRGQMGLFIAGDTTVPPQPKNTLTEAPPATIVQNTTPPTP